jgi:hypothetical protein
VTVSGDQIKGNEGGWVRGVYRRDEKLPSATFYPKNMKGRDHLGDLSIDGKITLFWIILNECGSGFGLYTGSSAHHNKYFGFMESGKFN